MRFDRLDSDKTAPFLLGPEGGAPVLLVHGFTGSPWDMRPLGEALATRGFRVRALRLPGHGTTPEALLRVTHEDWTLAVEDALLALHEEGGPVCVAGLSVGALLSLRVAARHPPRLRALALLAPALRLQGPRMALARALCRTGLLERAWPWLPKASTDLEDPAERAQAPVLQAIPSARLRDVFALQGRVREVLPQVRCPTLVVTARQDHVVAPECGPEVARGLTGAARVRHIALTRGFHILPRDRDRQVLAGEVGDFFAHARSDAAFPSVPGPAQVLPFRRSS